MTVAELLPTGGDNVIGQVFLCARPECKNESVKTTHNQKYCSKTCCSIETNRKIKEKYHKRAAIKRGKKRLCSICETPLSRYNENDYCGSCATAKRETHKSEAAALVGSVSWL
jgi:hypothetical protein